MRVTEPSRAVDRDASSDAILLDAVALRFGAVVALDGITLRVPCGSITGLVGRNGAGKSTSIRVLAGLVRPDTGRVVVSGLSLPDATHQVLATTGYLLADPALFAYLTPRETLRFLAEVYGVSRREGERRAEDLLRFFELEHVGDRLVTGFSTGMQKRLGLAAALVHTPRVLVLDEPFETLDPLMVRKLKRLLLGYVRRGASVLLSSHLLDAVAEVCDRVAILERGRVVADGPTAAPSSPTPVASGGRTLEDLYASVVTGGEEEVPMWLAA